MLTKKDKKKRYNKKAKTSSIHVFDAWGDRYDSKFMKNSANTAQDALSSSNLGGSIAGIAGGIGGIVEAGMANAQIADTTEQRQEAEDRANWQSSASDSNSLLNEMASDVQLNENIDWKSIRGSNGWQQAGNVLKGAISGASAGAKVGGGLGAIVGGLAGISSGLAGLFIGNKKAKTESAALSQLNKNANLAKAQTLTFKAASLDQQQDAAAQRAYTAYGGGINTPKFPDFPSEITEFNAGGSHEENPYDGIPQGIAPDGLPNLVEEGEVKYDNYIFSDRLMLSKEDKKKYKFLKGKTFADAAKKIKKQLGTDERPNDQIALQDLHEQLNLLHYLQEEKRAKRGLKGENRMMYAKGGHLFGNGSRQEIRDYMDAGFTRREARNLANGNFDLDAHTFDWSSTLQAAPALGSALGFISNLAEKPTHEYTKKLTQSEKPVAPITYTPTHQDIKLPRFDKSFYMNKADAQAAATRRAIREQNAGNPYATTAALLAADYQLSNTRGDIRKQAEEMDTNRILQEAQFNSTGRRADAEGLFKAASANATLQDKALTRDAEKKAMAAKLNIAEDQAYDTAVSSNMTSLFDNLGAIGKEDQEFALAAMKIFGEGKVTPEMQALMLPKLQKILAKAGYKYGGKLRKKKGYTI